MCTHVKIYFERLLQPTGWLKKCAANRYLLLVALLATGAVSYAQIAITQNANAQNLSQLLAGQGVTISNYTRTCDNNGSGTFVNNVNTNLGVSQGVVLATGRVSAIPNAANTFASTQFTTNSDPQLSTLTTGTIYDKCVLEFDIVPQGNFIKFNYVFASEEYPEFVCSQYNDVFGFFISGPNPGGGNYTNANIATIPNSNLPVCINSVNPGTSGTYNGTTWNSNNCVALNQTGFYTNNQVPLNTRIAYDGMTHVLTAIAAVTPCQTYHLKLAIADVGDRIYDSGVFLEAYSFTSAGITVSATGQLDLAGYSSAYEGCVGGTFRVSMPAAQPTDLYVDVVVSGTATNGSDYTSIPTTVVIPAGQTFVNIDLNPLQDGIAESAETVTVAVVNPCTGVPTSSASLTIQDNIPLIATTNDTSLCRGQSAQLSATGGAAYSWTPTTGLSNPNIANPVASPTATTNYIVAGTWGTCLRYDTVTIHVNTINTMLSTLPSDTICNGSTLQINSNTTGGHAPYTYLWSTASTANSITVATGGAYTITTTDTEGCSVSAVKNVFVSNPMATATPSHVLCNGAATGAVNVNITGANLPATFIWNDNNTQQNRSGLTAGTYNVTLTDANGCTAATSAQVTQPASAIALSLTNTSALCFGSSTASITSTVTGGTAPYTYNWGSGVITPNRTNLTAGTYNLTVADANSCSATASSVIAQPSAALAISLSTANILCYNTNNGSITSAVSGGVAPYIYNWGGGITTANRNNLSPGTYNVTVTDANSCSVTASSTITQPSAALALSLAGTNVACFGGNGGVLTSTVNGGTAPYAYNWGGGITTANRSNLTAGTYNLTITDANNCSATASSTITQPSAALALSLASTNVACFGGNNGVITSTVNGGTAPYTYNWGGGITTASRTGLSAGAYNLTITDANNCSATASSTITQPSAVLALSLAATNVACFGGNGGSIISTVVGGTAPYAYNWGGGITTANRTNLTAGTYSLTITDANNCSATAPSTITQPSAALALSLASTNVACFGGNGGAITSTVNGGTAPYAYNWGGGITTANRSNLTAGTYSLTITDANNCSATASSTITQPSAALALSLASTNVACFGGNGGAIISAVNGGTAPYAYNWGGGVTTANRTNLTAGTYNLTITDANNCSATASSIITQPSAALALNLTSTNVACFGGNGGAIISAVNGGTAPYAYNWGGGITTANRTGLSAGTYNLTITDANNCSATSSSTITQPSAALALSLAATNVACFGGNGGAITSTVNGGTAPYAYNWGGGITTANRTGLSAGTYNLTITDANNCSATASSIITQPSAALALTLASTNVACFGGNGGAITSTVNGGTAPYAYNWGGGITTANRSNLTAGTYSLTITDANNCSATALSVISQPTAALAATIVTTNVLCYGNNTGKALSSVTGGTAPYTYLWNNNATTANRVNVPAGTYTLTVTDINACSAIVSAEITQPAAALTIALVKANISCNGAQNGTLATTVSGGTAAYSYLWSDANNDANRTNLNTGNYRITTTDANGCSVSASATITQPNVLNVNATAQNVQCAGGTNGRISISVTGGTTTYNYLWNDNSTLGNRNNLTAGTYTITVTDSKGCTDSATATVTQPDSLVLSTTATNISCFGGSNGTITSLVSGGTAPYTYLWNGGINTADRTNLVAGTNYRLTVTDANNCQASKVTAITQPALLTATASSTNVSCNSGNNGTITINANGGTSPYTYTWSHNNQLQGNAATSLPAGSYTVAVSDINNCSTTVNATITQPGTLTVATTQINATCAGNSNGSINTNVAGGTAPYSYLWNDQVSTANRAGLTAGTYSVTVSDNKGCTDEASIVITQPASLEVTLDNTAVTCYAGNNGTITTAVNGGTAPYTYNWGGGVTTANRAYLSTGSYTVTVSDINGCNAVATSAITQPAAAISVSVVNTNVLCYAGSNGSLTANVTGGTGTYTYNWSNNANTASINNLTANTYTLTVSDENLCNATASSIISQPAAALSASLSTSNVLCYNGNSGSITATVNGGTAPYNYTWNDNVPTVNRTNLSAGSYSLSVTDANGCNITATATIAQPAAALSVSLTKTDVACFNGSNASITTSVNGGTGTYAYNWGGGIITANRSNLAAGTYTVTVNDTNNCSTSNNTTIAQPEALLAIAAKTDVACNAGNTGSITVTATGGALPYAFTWSHNNQEHNSISVSLPAGYYVVSVTDANNCSTSTAATITQPNALSLSTTVTNVSCAAGNNGSITTSTTGGTAAYAYLWNDNATTANRNNITAGNYMVTVTDNKGCNTSAAAFVSQPDSLKITATATTVSCNGGNNGSITTIVTGGTTPYTYNWSHNTQLHAGTAVSLPAGYFTVSVSDVNNCSASAIKEIVQPFALSATASRTNVSCYGGNDGSVSVYANGGTSPYNYGWSHNALVTNNTSTTLPAGYYNVSVSDANNCSTTIAATITQPAAIAAIPQVTDATCHGAQNGAVALNVSGGIAPYIYTWNNGQQNTVSNSGTLPAGYYTVQVTDENNCTASVSYTIAQPAAIALSTTHTAVSCYGGTNGTAAVNVTGGTLPYLYRWNNNNTAAQVQNLTANSYSVTVTDNNQCTAQSTVTIPQPAAITITHTHTDVACNNNTSGSINTHVQGGTTPYSYNWNNGQTGQNLNGLNTGSYTLTVTDVNQCTATSSATVVPTATLPVSVLPVNVTCRGYNNGKVNVAISGGLAPYTYQWNTGQTQQSLQALNVGTYVVTVTDMNQCSGTASASINQPDTLTVAITPVNVQCAGNANGAVTIIPHGGTAPYRFDWDDINGTNDAPNRSNLNPGIYKVLVADSFNCQASAVAEITEPGALHVTMALHNPNCYGDSSGAISVNTTGGNTPYQFAWSNNTVYEDLVNVAAGSYTVNVSDARGCSVTATTQLNNPAQLLISATHAGTSCYNSADGNIQVDVAGGASPYNYVWNDNVTTRNRNNVSAGSYTITVTDTKGCNKALTVPVSSPQQLTAIPSVNNIACHGEQNGSISVLANGGVQPYAYLWSNGENANTNTNLGIGNYTLTITDNKGCTVSSTYTITQPETALSTSIDSINNACFNQHNGMVSIAAEGGTQPYTYLWNTGSVQTTLTNITDGYYEVTITDANGCTIENSAPVAGLPELKYNALIGNPGCANGYGSIDVTVASGAAPYSFAWSNNTQAEDIAQAHTGIYNLTITDVNGCVYKQQYRIEEDPNNNLTVEAGADTTIKLGETVVLTGLTNSTDVSMVWALPTGLSCTECDVTFAKPVHTTTYTVTATDKFGCTATDEVTIDITPWGTVFVPNAFSPNGDGNNDIWEIFGSKHIWHSVTLMIFNRWGEKVFESNDANIGWDGMYKGEPAPQAVYVYVADITYLDGRREADLKGSLTLVR